MRTLAVAASVGALLALSASASQAAEPIMPLSEIQSGMQCTGLSVVRGTEISSFDAEVVDVVAGQQGQSGPRILVRISGPAVDSTGVGPGFSGSPLYCSSNLLEPERNAGALSEIVGEYGGKLVLATPIEEILGEPPAVPPGARSRPRFTKALAGPLTIAGLDPVLARRFADAGRRAGRTVIAAPAGPLASFPPQDLRPGAAVSVGITNGDIAISGIGTVAYRDGDAVWAFGHPFEGVGPRSLLLQDAYVFTVVSNPFGVEPALTYKLAAAGHDLGTTTNDATSAVVGRTGGLPRTIPVRAVAHDVEGGRRVVVEGQVADESALGYPAGASALALAGPLAVTQAGAGALRGVPTRTTGSMCVKVELDERKRPIRFCNRYVSGGAPDADAGGLGAIATDFSNAVGFLDAYNFGPLHVTRVEANLKLRRGLRQAYMTRLSLPRRARAGSRMPVRLVVRRVNGPRRTIRFTLRVPRSLPEGPAELELVGTAAELFTDELVIDFDELLTAGEEDGEDPGDPGPRNVEELAAQIEGLRRFDGVGARFRREGRRRVEAELPRVLRDPDIRISGRASAGFSVTR